MEYGNTQEKRKTNCKQMEHNKINLILINRRVMTFNAEDYIKLRREYRIIGKLIGVAPPYPRNVNLLHLPAVYSEFEAKLMLDENIANIQKKEFRNCPSEEMKNAFANHQKDIIQELQDAHVKSKLECTISKMEQIIMGKRKKLMKLGVLENETELNPEKIIKDEELKYRQSFNTQNLYSQVPTEYQFNYAAALISECPIKNSTKYQVFHDLWKKNLYITNAENFGGDFLTYNADPMNFHAQQIVHIVHRQDMLEPHFICSCGRLSVSVKKKCTFAYVHNNKVVYQTFDWDNPKIIKCLINDNNCSSDLIDKDIDVLKQ